MYKSANTSSPVLMWVNQDEIVTCGATNGSWAYVKYGGIVGYMLQSSYTVVTAAPSEGTDENAQPTQTPDVDTQPTPTQTPDVDTQPTPTQTPGVSSSSALQAITTEDTKLYKEANTASGSYGTIAKGKLVTCLKVSGSWARVQAGSYTGYVLKSTIKSAGTSGSEPSDSTPTQTPAPSPTTSPTQEPSTGSSSTQNPAGGIEVVSTVATKLYKEANATSASYGTIAKGKKFTCLKVSGNWARVQAGNYTGYVLKSTIKSTGATTAPDPSDGSSSSTSKPDTSNAVVCYVKKSTPLYSSVSLSATEVASLKAGDKVLVIQVRSSWAALYTADGTLGYLSTDLLSKTKITAASSGVILKDWFADDIDKKIFSVGTKARVIDVDTRLEFDIRRRGGILHADVETLSKEDTAIMLKAYGGAFSWNRRAIWVVIDGVYYAASMNGMGHGNSDVDGNGLEGHFCIHFLNSQTHVGEAVDKDHQNAVMKAFNTTP